MQLASVVQWYWKLTHRPFTFECFINKAIKIEPCPISYIRSRVGWRPDLSWGTGDEHVLFTWWENSRQRNNRVNIFSKNSVTCMNEWMNDRHCAWSEYYSTGPIDRVYFSGIYSLYIQWYNKPSNETYKRNPLGCIIIINENGTFSYNASAEHWSAAEHEGHARTIHTSGVKM